MNLVCVVLGALVCSAHGGWWKDLRSPRGVDLGGGLTVHLLDSQRKNATLLERHNLKLDYGSYGLSVSKASKRSAVQLDFTINQPMQGRSKKEEEQIHHIIMLLGYKFASMLTVSIALMGGLVFKALGVAKIALIVSTILVIAKLFHHEPHPQHHLHHTPAYVEIEHPPESHASMGDYASSSVGVGYTPSGTANYYSYSNYAPSAAGENALTYGTSETSVGNSSLTGNQQVASVSRRRDLARRKIKLPVLTIHRYSVDS